MSKKINVEVIPFEAKIKVTIPGTFYGRIQQLFMYVSNLKDAQAGVNAILALRDKKEPKDEYEASLQTVTMLIHEIEREAKAQGVFEPKEIEVDDDYNIISEISKKSNEN